MNGNGKFGGKFGSYAKNILGRGFKPPRQSPRLGHSTAAEHILYSVSHLCILGPCEAVHARRRGEAEDLHGGNVGRVVQVDLNT